MNEHTTTVCKCINCQKLAGLFPEFAIVQEESSPWFGRIGMVVDKSFVDYSATLVFKNSYLNYDPETRQTEFIDVVLEEDGSNEDEHTFSQEEYVIL